MSILTWDKPEKIMTTEEWQSVSADGAPPGVYIPNMSDADAAAWRARLIGKHGDHPRVEVRKTLDGTQIKIVLCPDEVTVSMNGTARFRTGTEDSQSAGTFGELVEAVREAAIVMLRKETGR